MRFNILNDHVDKFVLVEADKTFTNKQKKLVFDENKEKFTKFLEKVVHVKVLDMPCGDNPWERERFQRRCILRGLDGCKEDDLILVSDADEIPNPLLLENIKNLEPGKTAWLEQRFFYYYLNVEQPVKWIGTALARYGDLKDPNEVRRGKEPSLIIRGETGWHFSFLGDVDHIREKIASFSHTECDTPEIHENLENRLDNLMCIFGGHKDPFKVVNLDESFPKYIVNNLEKFEKYIKRVPPKIVQNGLASSDDKKTARNESPINGLG